MYTTILLQHSPLFEGKSSHVLPSQFLSAGKKTKHRADPFASFTTIIQLRTNARITIICSQSSAIVLQTSQLGEAKGSLILGSQTLNYMRKNIA